MTESLPFAVFWKKRNFATSVVLDRVTVNNASILVAFASYKVGVTPNQLSIASGLSALFAFSVALFLPTDQMILSVVIIFLLSQLSYIFDCADGQLARATDTVSDFGEFLDKGIDVVSSFLSFGAFFVYAYRHFEYVGLTTWADTCLLVGFTFLTARISRFAVLEMFKRSPPETHLVSRSDQSPIRVLLISLMDHQCSLFNMLLFLLWPAACLSIFVVQAMILGAVYVRYFLRARHAFDVVNRMKKSESENPAKKTRE